MQDYLKDIVQHTQGLNIDLVKITGTASETSINSIAEDRSIILEAKFKNPEPEFPIEVLGTVSTSPTT